MQITIRGALTLQELKQALFEKLNEVEDDFALHHSQGATLYFNPTNEIGEPVLLRRDGKAVSKIFMDGPYRSKADELVP
jgi:hypothetical protein